MKKCLIILALSITTSAAAQASSGEVASYLNCYALQPSQKQKCQQKITESATKEYIYEAERLGFAEFLRDHKKPCNSISQGLLFNDKKQAYKAICDDGNSYFLRFNLIRVKFPAPWSEKTINFFWQSQMSHRDM